MTVNYVDQLRNIEIRFRNGNRNLELSDRNLLKYIIVNEVDGLDLQSCIYIFSYTFDVDPEVLNVCKKYTVEIMRPGMSAVCFKALFRYWCIYDEIYISSIKKYLHAELWDEFYDEIYFLVRFLNGEDGIPFRTRFQDELSRLEQWARDSNVGDLLDAWQD